MELLNLFSFFDSYDGLMSTLDASETLLEAVSFGDSRIACSPIS